MMTLREFKRAVDALADNMDLDTTKVVVYHTNGMWYYLANFVAWEYDPYPKDGDKTGVKVVTVVTGQEPLA